MATKLCALAVPLLLLLLAGGAAATRHLHDAPVRAFSDGDIAAAATRHGMTAAQLRDLLTSQPDLHLGTGGQMHFACNGIGSRVPPPTTNGAGLGTLSGGMPGDGDPDPSQAFLLHSRPSATKKIYLNFKGCPGITNSYWNPAAYGYYHPKLDTIDGAVFSIDSDPAHSKDELQLIVSIWRGVAEDFAPFNVDVTTESPGDYHTNNYGMMACIGGDPTDWFCTNATVANQCKGAGGVGTVGGFGVVADYPVWIWPDWAKVAWDQPGYAQFIAQAISHEVGHTFGLNHMSDAANEYWRGNDGFTAIMGLGSWYDKPSLWSQGDYTGATRQEREVDLIASYAARGTTAVGFAPSDFGSSASDATPLCAGAAAAPTCTDLGGGRVAARVEGTISQSTETDVLKFTVSAAGDVEVKLYVVPGAPIDNPIVRTNLFAELTLYRDGLSNVVASTKPTGFVGTDLSISQSLQPGTYYVAVRPSGTQYYSSYGVGGTYKVQVTGPISGQTPAPSPSPTSSPVPSPVPSPTPTPSPSPVNNNTDPGDGMVVTGLYTIVGSTRPCRGTDLLVPGADDVNEGTGKRRVALCYKRATFNVGMAYVAADIQVKAFPGKGALDPTIGCDDTNPPYIRLKKDLNVQVAKGAGRHTTIIMCKHQGVFDAASVRPLQDLKVVKNKADCAAPWSLIDVDLNMDANGGTIGTPMWACKLS